MSRPSHQETILDAGLRVFHRQGFNASGVQDVVTEAGVPKGSFYNHYSSKDALGVAVLERYWDQAAHARSILEDRFLAPLVRIERHFEMLDSTEAGCLIGNFSAELSMHDIFRDALREKWAAWITALARCFSEGQQDGSVQSHTSALDLARNALALFEGALLIARVERSPAAMVSARRAILRLARV